jgi:hypothetical protein
MTELVQNLPKGASMAASAHLRFTHWRRIRRVLDPRLALVTRSFDIDRARTRIITCVSDGKFDAGQGNRRTAERLEVSYHRSATAFDRSMIWPYEIVEAPVTFHLNILPLRILPPLKPKGWGVQVAIERDLALRKSLTWDRGSEITEHAKFTVATDVKVFFCDPNCPWQRGS